MTWFPKNKSNLSAGAIGSASAPQGEKPMTDLPEIGETILILAQPWGHQIVAEGMNVPNGSDIIEVEVKSLKKAKVTIE